MRLTLRIYLPLLLAARWAGAATPEERALEPYQPPPVVNVKAWTREKLLGFAHELADFVQKNHVVTDPARKTYGMVYEFWKDGKKLQEFGFDSMHDGAWWMSAMATMQRADPHGDWLERTQNYQVPFYVNVLNHSDVLFPKMQPTEDDKHPWTHPVKGWAPTGWDDGSGFDRKTGQPLAKGYSTGSNELSQDLADTLLNVWLTTRDPQITEALGHLRDYKEECFGGIQGIDIAAAISAGQADGFLKYRQPEFTPQALSPYYTGLFEKKAHRLPSSDDGLAWLYRQSTAGALIAGELPRSFATFAIARCYAAWAATETFFDDRPSEPGVWFFDRLPAPGYLEGQGRLEVYSSAGKNCYGPRGAEYAWVAAGVLPELKSSPALWDLAAKRAFTGPLVRLVDESPVTDGTKDPIYAKSVPIGDDSARVTLISDPRNLHVFIETTRPQLTVTFQEDLGETRGTKTASTEETSPDLREDARDLAKKSKGKSSAASSPKKKGKSGAKSDRTTKTSVKEKAEPAPPPPPPFVRGAKLTIARGGQNTLVNEKGEALLATVVCKDAEFKQGEGDSWVAELRIPYTYVPGQKAWINGVDFGRYKVGIDTAPPQIVSLMSDASRIQKRLETGVLGTIDYWHKVWKDTGILPSGWPAPQAGSWVMSDAGGYAQLLHTIALWVIYQDGRREWEIIREQFPAAPSPAPPLPSSVRKLQGLE